MKKDITQELMNEVGSYWSDIAKGGKRNEILEKFSTAHQMAMRFGNFNYQIENGGISQWIFNNYMADDIEELLEFSKQGTRWGISGMECFQHIFSTVEELMNKWEERSTHTCSTCDGSGEVTYTDIDDIEFVDEEIESEMEENGEITLTCDDCSGSGEYEEDNEYPSEFKGLENKYFEWNVDERIAVIDNLVKSQLEEQEKEREINAFTLRRGTKTKVAIQQNVHTRTLHLLDLDEDGTTSLTNAIDEIEGQIREQYSFDTMYLYHTDGMVTQFKDGRFVHVKDDDAFIYRPFYLEIKSREIV